MSDIQPSNFVLEHTPWSVSKANTAKQCPKKFFFQYIRKPRLKEKPYNWDAILGQAVHLFLENLLRGCEEDRCHTIVETQYDFTTKEKEQYLSFLPNAKKFLRMFNDYKTRHEVKEIQYEQKLSVDINGNPVTFFDNQRGFIRGVLDMSVLFAQKPNALIVDHKTGKRRLVSYFKPAFDTYALLLKAKQPELQRIKMGVNFLRDGDVDFMDGMLNVADIQPVLESIIKFLNESTQMAHNFELVQPGPLCNWCDYMRICPAHADGANHEEEN